MVVPLKGFSRRGRLSKPTYIFPGDRVVFAQDAFDRGIVQNDDIYIVVRVEEVPYEQRKGVGHACWVYLRGMGCKVSGGFLRKPRTPVEIKKR